jgi:type VI protein secretion system component VasK
VLAADYPFLDILWTMFIFFLFVIWIWILITVFADIFRRKDVGGGSKALWIIFVIVLPYLGVFVYLIARGHKMQEHAIESAQAQEQAMRQYVQSVAPAASPADELAKLADLKAKGVISDAEYEAAKAKALA